MLRLLSCLFAAAVFLLGCNESSKANGYEIGIDPSWYPLQLTGQEKNLLAFSIELLSLIAKEEGLKLSIQRATSDQLLWGLKTKKYNAIISSLYPYTFYDKQFSFSDLFLYTGPVVVTLKEFPIQTLQGKEVGVVKGSSSALLLQTTPGIILRGYDSIPFALEALENREVNAAAIDVLIAQNYVRDLYKDTMEITSPPLNKEGLRIVSIFKESPELLERFNRGLTALKKKGDYEKLLKKWGFSPDGK